MRMGPHPHALTSLLARSKNHGRIPWAAGFAAPIPRGQARFARLLCAWGPTAAWLAPVQATT